MDISLIFQGVMTLLSPFLQKAGEKAAETIGEKFASKTFEKDFWHNVKTIFIKDEEVKQIAAIESKQIASAEDVKLIENKLSTELNSNPQFAAKIQSAFNFSSTNMFIAQQLLKSIKASTDKLIDLYDDRNSLVSNPIPRGG